MSPVHEQPSVSAPKSSKGVAKTAAKTVSDVKSNSTPASSSSPSGTPASSVAPLRVTPLADIKTNVDRLRKLFHQTRKTHDLQFRLNQLRNLYFAVKDNQDAICEALYKDFRRSPTETRTLEIAGSLNECLHTMANLSQWMKPKAVTDVPLAQKATPIYVESIPLGVVLVITPFNYPLYMAMPQVVGALAAGNVVVLKQSELTPNFSQLFSDLLEKALDPDVFYSVNGAVPETTEVLAQKFDKIIYTGNGMVGRIIAKKAAETLTPVILELGGKLPGFVLEDVRDKDLAAIARRIVWGRFTNGGQTCVAIDYLLVHELRRALLVKEIKRVMEEEFYPTLDKNDTSYTHVIHDRAFNNMVKYLDASEGNIITGGERDAATRFFAPTVVDNCTWDDLLMQQEIFGPLLPILEYSDLSLAVTELVDRHDTPLALYVFLSNLARGKNVQLEEIMTRVRLGGAILNDSILHVGLSNAPFGGIGELGYGAYHGEHSFKAFSHERVVMEIALWKDAALSLRYPPATQEKAKLVGHLMQQFGGYEWFGRTENVRKDGPSALFLIYSGIAGVAALGYYFYLSM